MSSSYDMFNPVSDPFSNILNPNAGNNNFPAVGNQDGGFNWGDDWGDDWGEWDLGGGGNMAEGMDMGEGGWAGEDMGEYTTPQHDPLYGEPEGGNYEPEWEPPDTWDPPPLDDDDDWWDPPVQDDPIWEPDMPDFEMPDFELPDFEMPEIASPESPEEEEKKEKRPNMGFYDVGSASAGFRPGEIEHDPDRLFAGQVSGKIGRDHPLERALFGR